MLDWSMSAPNVGPPLSASEERTWAMVAHIGVLVAAWFAMGFLCPLVIWLIYRYRSDYVRQHALESLNFQLSLLIYTAVAVILILITFGLGVLIIVPLILIGAVAALVVIVVATVAAAGGSEYRYPLTIRFVK
ncbi:DUF4870 domain-containing protein [Kribbella capetownensis]|uniref:DUF4870 domain-containing protein n=1 Tax=Kribbella capetownensis TaxID=1572659 RepID=A0A4R0JIR9_9ACTN|nr:DUF4870 domain-containing protein [Kribbella capetownensis]TCC44676.1 DUF4870 domain-containing protein [Kribbella capetownensis]